VKGIDLYSKSIIPLVINILVVVLLVLAVSGLTLHRDMTASSFSFVIAIDVSQSMGATDLYPDRITAAKETSKDFIDLLPRASRVGAVSFSGNTYVQSELTDNKEILKDSIDDIQITEYGGTDIFEAISISLNLLRDEENKAIILLSDGQINVGNMDDVIELANNKNVLVHTIGVGTLEGGETLFGISKLDEDSLKSLSYNTGGEFFKVDSIEDMKTSFKQIIPLTKKNGSNNLFAYLIMTAIFFFIAGQLYGNSKKISI